MSTKNGVNDWKLIITALDDHLLSLMTFNEDSLLDLGVTILQ